MKKICKCMKLSGALCIVQILLVLGAEANSNPVLFLHGWNSNGNIWDNMAGLLEEDGWDAEDMLTLNLYGSIFDSRTVDTPIEEIAEWVANELDTFYKEREKVPFDVIAHSMGGLVLRTIIDEGLIDGSSIVPRRFIPIATPHYGQNVEISLQAEQMTYGSPFLWERAENWHFKGKALPTKDVLCISGIVLNNDSGWDGLVHYWSAALAGTEVRYVDRRHSSIGLGGASPVIYSCPNGINDAVYVLVRDFLLYGTVVDQDNADFIENGGIESPNTPHGTLFVQVVDSEGVGIPYSGNVIDSTDQDQGFYYYTDPSTGDELEIRVNYKHRHGAYTSLTRGDANLRGVEYLLSSRPCAGLLEGDYKLSVKASKGGTYPSFNKSGISVTAGRTTVVQFSPPVPALDLVFCIDTTGSMRDDIAAVKASASEIVDLVADSVDDYRIAVVAYRDCGDAYVVKDFIDFSSDPTDLVTAINSLTANGGGDFREAVFAALMHTIDGSSIGGWRSGDVSRSIIIMGDAPPHDPDVCTGYTLNDVIIAAGGEPELPSDTSLMMAAASVMESASNSDLDNYAHLSDDGMSTEAAITLNGEPEVSVEFTTLMTPDYLLEADAAPEPISIFSIVIGSHSGTRDYFSALSTATGGQLFNAANASEVVDAIKEAIGEIRDDEPPVVDIIVPSIDAAIQDGITLTATAEDESEVVSLLFTVREVNGADTNGTPVGFEDIPAVFETNTSHWARPFDSAQLPDGYYQVVATATDEYENVGSSAVVPFSIRNWAIIELLPISKEYRAGRTVPIKFSLRIKEDVDPKMPFVVNENLMIKIANGEEVLQTSYYGDTSIDYRIDYKAEHYITNFKTDKNPDEYMVDIWRDTYLDFLIDAFSFVTEPDHRKYKQWKSEVFTAQELATASISGSLSDPDGDGIINLIEYAYDLDPTKFNAKGRPFAGKRGDYFTMTYRQNKKADNLLFTVESSPCLGSNTWSGIGLEEVSRTDSNTHWSVTVQDAEPMSEQLQGFMRVKVEVAE